MCEVGEVQVSRIEMRRVRSEGRNSNDQPPAGCENPVQFVEHGAGIGEMFEQRARSGFKHRGVGQRQAEDVGLEIQPGDVPPIEIPEAG